MTTSHIAGDSSPIIAVVVPAYRVEGQIERTLRGIPDFAQHIIVVDDASSDRTAEIVDSLKLPRVTLLRHDRNKGVGGATMTGYQHALELGAEIIVKMDGDDQMDPAALQSLIDPLLRREADYAKGNRFRDLRALRTMPLVRRVGNMGLTFLAKMSSGYWNVSDPNNGYTAIRREALAKLDLSRVHERYFFESSMLIQLNMANAVVCDVPIPARYQDEVSNLRIHGVLWEFPINHVMGLAHRIFWKYLVLELSPVGLFVLLGAPSLLFGLTFGLWRWYVSTQTGVPQTTGTVMAALLPFLIGFELLLQALVIDTQNVPRKPICRSSS